MGIEKAALSEDRLGMLGSDLEQKEHIIAQLREHMASRRSPTASPSKKKDIPPKPSKALPLNHRRTGKASQESPPPSPSKATSSGLSGHERAEITATPTTAVSAVAEPKSAVAKPKVGPEVPAFGPEMPAVGPEMPAFGPEMPAFEPPAPPLAKS